VALAFGDADGALLAGPSRASDDDGLLLAGHAPPAASAAQGRAPQPGSAAAAAAALAATMAASGGAGTGAPERRALVRAESDSFKRLLASSIGLQDDPAAALGSPGADEAELLSWIADSPDRAAALRAQPS
jgi:hypothetical protein